MIAPSIYKIKRELLESVPAESVPIVSAWFDTYITEFGQQYKNTHEHIKSLGNNLQDYEKKYVLRRLANSIAQEILDSKLAVIESETDDFYKTTTMRVFVCGEK